jgi:hypothetical protein
MIAEFESLMIPSLYTDQKMNITSRLCTDLARQSPSGKLAVRQGDKKTSTPLASERKPGNRGACIADVNEIFPRAAGSWGGDTSRSGCNRKTGLSSLGKR